MSTTTHTALAPSPRGRFPTDLTVGVVTGGHSAERDRSLLSGRTALTSLRAQGVDATSIDLADARFLEQVSSIDVAFLAIAGKYAEDGKLQGLLETLRIPYTGSGVLASAIGMNKEASKAFAANLLIPTLPHVLVDNTSTVEETLDRVTAEVRYPVMIKPTSEGGSVGAMVVKSPDELRDRLVQAGDDECAESVLAERFVAGRSITVGVLSSSGEQTALPPLEAVPVGEFYDFASKRDDTLHTYQCPPAMPASEIARLQTLAVRMHVGLGCIGYSRSDFIVSEEHGTYFLEINTLPGLSRTGNLATMATAAGIEYDTLIDHILRSALNRMEYVS